MDLSDPIVPDAVPYLTRRVPLVARRRIAVIGAANGYGAGDPGCQDGPEVLRALDFLRDLEGVGAGLHWDPILRLDPTTCGPTATPLQKVATLAGQLAQSVCHHLAAGEFPLVIGGDHSSAVGTWSGVWAHIRPLGSLGLIWIDAHMDSHTPRTSPSQNLHGMPLASLLGQGEAVLTGIGGPHPKLQPEDVCLIGVRSFEGGEADLLRRLGVRVYFMDEVHRRGFGAVLEEALNRVTERTAAYGISMDVDALDPTEEPGVGTPVADGLRRAEVTAALRSVHDDPRLAALEIVEYNPWRDSRFTTAEAVHDLCASVIGVQGASHET